MANTNFPLQYSHLTKNNCEIWCIHVKAWLSSRDVLETIEKDFEEPIKGVTLTLAKRDVIQKARRKDQ